MDVSKSSSPIDRAPGARSKSGEFVETSILYSKLSSISCLKPLKTGCTFWDPDSVAIIFGEWKLTVLFRMLETALFGLASQFLN